MKRAVLVGAATLCTFVLTGCGTVQRIGHNSSGPVSPSDQPITFFQNTPASSVRLTLGPDPLVRQQMPNVPSPNTAVIVYLPVYPGATSAKPVAGIGDMGTPLNGDLVDGSAYFQSKDSQAQISAWYTQQFKKFGYTTSGQGSMSDHGKTTSSYFAFTKNVAPGNPMRDPDISLGFLNQKQGGETIFKLNVSYIVTPPRPEDSYLPPNIVRVILTQGKTTKTMTDKKWIANVVQMINTLQVSTPGISAGPAATNGVPTMIHAAFYEENNSVINVTYSILPATITVGNSKVALNARVLPALIRDLNSVFGN